MKRSIVLILLSLSPLFMLLGSDMTAMAASVTTTTTQTTTTFVTLTGSGATTLYQTVTEITSVQTLTGTTYTNTGAVVVPVLVVTTIRHTIYATRTIGVGEVCCPASTTTYYTTEVVGQDARRSTQTVYVQSQVLSAVTTQYATNLPTTVFSTTTSTSTYSTDQVVSITNTQTLTSVTEIQPPPLSISDMNLLLVVVLVGLVLAALGFMISRRRGKGMPTYVPEPEAGMRAPVATAGFCVKCGTPLKVGAKFCGKCGLPVE